MTSKRSRIGLAIGAVLAAIAVLTVASISNASTFYYTVDEFRHLDARAAARYVQVNGTLAPGVRWDPATITLRFTLVGEQPGTPPLPVVYTGPEPAPFNPGTPVVVGGRLGPDGVFVADRIMIKCPSKYTAAPGG